MTPANTQLKRRLEAAEAFAERRALRGAGMLYLAEVAGGTIAVASPWARVSTGEDSHALTRWRVAWWPQEDNDLPSDLNDSAAEYELIALDDLAAVSALEPHLGGIRELANRQIRLLTTLAAEADGNDREQALGVLLEVGEERRRAFPLPVPVPLAERPTAVAIGPEILYGRRLQIARDVEAVIGLLDGDAPPLIRYDSAIDRATLIAHQLLRTMYDAPRKSDWREDPGKLDARRAGESQPARALRALALAEMRRELTGADAYAADSVIAGTAVMEALGPVQCECRELALLLDARLAHAVKGLATLPWSLFAAGGVELSDELERRLKPLAALLVPDTRLAHTYVGWWARGPGAVREAALAPISTFALSSMGGGEPKPQAQRVPVSLDMVVAGLVPEGEDLRLVRDGDPPQWRASLPLDSRVATELRRLRDAWTAGEPGEVQRAGMVLEARARLSAGSRPAPPIAARVRALWAHVRDAGPAPPFEALLPAVFARVASENVTLQLDGDELVATVPPGLVDVTTRTDLEGLDSELAVLLFAVHVAPRVAARQLMSVAASKPTVREAALRGAQAALQAALRAGDVKGAPRSSELPQGDLPPEADEGIGAELLRAAVVARGHAAERVIRNLDHETFWSKDEGEREALLADRAEDVAIIRDVDALLP